MSLPITLVIFAIILSSIIHNIWQKLPMALLQIVFGTLIGFIFIHHEIELAPEFFMLLIIAPLLFREAEEADLSSLWKLKKQVFAMVFLLVFLAVFVIGFVLHLFLPGLPMMICFAIGAILGPTDLVAVMNLAGRIKIGKNVMTILKGEGLINDASGLIALKFSVAAFFTGSFSLVQAGGELIWSSLGGVAVGIILVLLKQRATKRIRRISKDHAMTYVLIDLLVPFLAYLLSELIGVSGILAAVAAGTVQAMHMKQISLMDAEFREIKTSVWDMLKFILNSIVFLLLGLQLPSIIKELHPDQLSSNQIFDFFVIIVTLWLTMMLVRLIGAWVFARSAMGKGLTKWRNLLVLTISGVKGTVSLAAAFSLPFVMANGNDFAERPLLLFIVAGVVIFSFLMATIFLPVVAENHSGDKRNLEIKLQVINDVIAKLRRQKNHLYAIAMYKRRRRATEERLMSKKDQTELKRIRKRLFEIEERTINLELDKNDEITDVYYQYLLLLETIYHQRHHTTTGILLRHFSHKLRFLPRKHLKEWLNEQGFHKIQALFADNSTVIRKELIMMRKYTSDELVDFLMEDRDALEKELNSSSYETFFVGQQYLLFGRELLHGYATEREIIYSLLSKAQINNEEAARLLLDVNKLETHALESGQENDMVHNLLRYNLSEED
jgi:CPA1 family monovalent cation:H+ antiporter